MEKITDTYYDSQWNLQLMNVPLAWEYTYGKDSVIALIDSGVDASHKDLGWNTDIYLTTSDSIQARKAKYQPVLNAIKSGNHPKILSGWNFIDDNNDTYDDYRHGTSLAGIMCADVDNEGIVGVAPDGKIRPYKVVNGNGWTTQKMVADAVADAIDDNVDVINFSLAWVRETEKLMTANIQEAISQGIIVVAAVGNDNKEMTCYPASIDGIIAVGGCNAIGKRWVHNDKLGSNYGGMTFSAPADAQISTQYMRSRYEPKEGTSMACANTSGVMALLKTIDKSITNKDIIEYFKSFKYNSELGYGVLDAYDIIRYFVNQPQNEKLDDCLQMLEQLKTAILKLGGDK